MHTWRKLAPAVLLALPITLASARADPELTPAQQIDQLKRDLAQLRKDVDQIKANMMNNDLRGARIEEQLRQLLDMMARQQEVITRRAGYGPGADLGNGGAPPSTATITVQNQYPAAATFRLNGRAYVIEPYRTLTVNGVPVGTYNYEIEVEGYGLVQPLQNETLRPVGRKITIFAR